MNISMILEMSTSVGERAVVTAGDESLTAAQLLDLAHKAAHRFAGHPAVLYLGANHLAYPVALFGAALAGVPLIPVNYRLGESQLTAILARHPGAVVLRPDDLDALVHPAPDSQERADGEGASGSHENGEPVPTSTVLPDQDGIAALIYTSGTTAEPKAAVLRHRHLLAYVWNTCEFASAADGDAALVAAPPYHIAGLTNLLSNLYTGRRVVYLAAFDAGEWLDVVRRERITHAMVVPTMLARIVAEVADDDAGTPTLRSLAYGGARTPRPVLERALRIFPTVGFVNAYGLTETASSVAVLGAEDHRAAAAAQALEERARLGSVGRALPGIEIEIRGYDGNPAGPGETGLVFVRGEQISGEYGGRSALDPDGWFATQDLGHLDADGYLFIDGRADDTIIRGGENIAPAEIEDVLLAYPGIVEAVVVGVSDPEWGQRLVAVVVGDGDPAEIRGWVRERLRSSKTPDTIVFRAELPKTETGKLLRRTILAELETTHA
jgi:acyl-CoA synthetase (AMP-forming)/AMP-acid ligase II